MRDRTASIARDSNLCDTMPPILDKYIVDFVNNADVVEGHLRVQMNRSDIFARMYDGVSGKSARRQRRINAGFLRTADGGSDWLKHLTSELAHANREVAQQGLAIARVNESVSQLHFRLASVGENVASELGRLSKDLQSELDRLDTSAQLDRAKTDAQGHLENVISRWKGVRCYDRLSVLGRCYVALEELRWGFFGYYCRMQQLGSRSSLLETATNKVMQCMVDDLGLSSPAERVDTRAWLQPDNWQEGADGIAYLSEDYGERVPPIVAIIGGRIPRDQWSLDVPLISDASRLVRTLIDGMFDWTNEGE